MQYPLGFKILDISDNILYLFDLSIVPQKKEFLILESLNYRDDKAKIIYIVKFNNKLVSEEIRIGRNEMDEKNNLINDFSDNDDSISRIHAILKKDKSGNIIIEDKSSTFGSSVLIKGNIKLREEKINFQIGSSYISAYLINDEKIN